jgi:hypothetical protein
MNGRKAKAISKVFYGQDGSHRVRDYRRYPITGAITAGFLRRKYQNLKKDCLHCNMGDDRLMPW